jgi:ppGpp synthetase/RelA/SpoT-type nucleotidyltranferase
MVTPAMADCAEDIALAEKELMEVPEVKTGAIEAIEKWIKKAKSLLAKGKKKGCVKMVNKAREKIVDEK